jgi:hypothetical protein
MRDENLDGSSHWWLVGPRGVIDLMYGPADRRRLKSGDSAISMPAGSSDR